MAHKVINDKVVVDWTTGDPEGDRLTLLSAYRDFITELSEIDNEAVKSVFEKWQVDTGNQIDEVPRIWIKRPE